MCVAVPAKIREIKGQEALADLQGNILTISIALVPEVQVGQYVLIHAGFAIHTMEEEEALESLALWEELSKFAQDL